LKHEIAQWVNEYGGQATVAPSTAVRINRVTIEELLTSNESIDQIIPNCN